GLPFRPPAGPALQLNKPVDHAFAPAAVDRYTVALKPGEYCQGKVDQKGGSVNVAIYGPGDARIRNVGGPATGPKNFAFEAPVAGTYRIVLRSPATPAESYTIAIDKITTLAGRLQPAPAKDRYTSPKIAALRDGKMTLAAFWQDLQTPLIEPLDDKDALVTFLWRAQSE